jgi:biotin synthase-like enzyme
MIVKVKELGLETCATLGLLRNDEQAKKLKQSG